MRVERELAKKQEEFMEYFTSVTNVLEHMKVSTGAVTCCMSHGYPFL